MNTPSELCPTSRNARVSLQVEESQEFSAGKNGWIYASRHATMDAVEEAE